MTNIKPAKYPILPLSLVAVTGVIVSLAYLFFDGPLLASGFQYQILAENLEEVSALAFDTDGNLYATLEKNNKQGQVIRIQQGRTSTYFDGLSKPDGILLRNGIIYVTSEAGSPALLIYGPEGARYLEGLSNAEGIASAGSKKILVIEDKKLNGRLLRIDPVSGEIETLLRGLKEGEGVCQTPGGEIYYVEKSSDRLARYTNGKPITVVSGLIKPAYLNCLADGSILITEDRTSFGRLIHYKHGVMSVLATKLRAPQSVIIGPNGNYYLAEQGRNRILIINKL